MLLVRQPLTMAKPINQPLLGKAHPLFVATIYFMRLRNSEHFVLGREE